MDNRRLTIPERKNYEVANEYAYRLASEQIAGIADIEQQCHHSDARYQEIDSEKTILIRYLNQTYRITLPAVDVSLDSGTGEVTLRDKLLIVHYFIRAKGTPLAGKMIPFRDLPEGKVYYPTFEKRTSQPLLDCFGKDPPLLLKATKGLGGHQVEYGDMAVTINAFSRVPITMVLWRGDEEFAPQGNLLFDATIVDYLPTEDITVLCEIITWRLIRSVRGT